MEHSFVLAGVSESGVEGYWFGKVHSLFKVKANRNCVKTEKEVPLLQYMEYTEPMAKPVSRVLDVEYTGRV